MIQLIEILNYRCLRYVSVQLDRFHVLIGANASGKSTFLDAIQFLSDIINVGIDKAIETRGANFEELTFAGNGSDIEFAFEVRIPEKIASGYKDQNFTRIRYEIKIGKHKDTSENSIKEEKVILLTETARMDSGKKELRIKFPGAYEIPKTLLVKRFRIKNFRRVVTKNPGGNDNFYLETAKEPGKSGWLPSFRLGYKKSALANLPEDETKFPAASWLKTFMQQGVQSIILNSLLMRNPSPPGLGSYFRTDGSNLPWVIENLRKDKVRYQQWIEHIRTLLPDVIDIITVERDEDKKRYLKMRYKNGIEVPSWLVSDGTLRLLALSILAYIKDISGVFLIEEPENGIHPAAIECVYQSLSSVYNAQVLLASHSPVILSLVVPKDLLCFGKTENGMTDIVSGTDHPKLREWQGNPNLSVMFAGGILS